MADSKLRRSGFSRQMMIKDFLLDDLSSCSSSGFRSYPRRQCCAATPVRLLLEIDLKKSNKQINYSPCKNQPTLERSNSRTKSALSAVITAVRNLWRKNDQKPNDLSQTGRSRFSEKSSIGRSRFSGETAGDEPKSAAAVHAAEARKSESSSSKNDSWTDSEFTAASSDYSGNSEVVSLSENDVVLVDSSPGKAVVSQRGNTTGTNAKKAWRNEEKEQFSPVSILDFPHDDEDDEVSSPFQQTLLHIEGTKKKLMHKIRQFESITQLEPINLEKRIALSESDNKVVDSMATLESIEAEDKSASGLLEQLKTTMDSSQIKAAEMLLLDFFNERMSEDHKSDQHEVLETAKDWISGEPREMFLDWEVPKNRLAYIKAMERGVQWSKVDDEEKNAIAFDLEAEVLTSLVDELLLDLFAS